MASLNKKNISKDKTEKQHVSDLTEKSNDKLTIDDIFKLMDLYFNRRYVMYAHAKNSFDKFIDDDIKNFLIKSDNTFFEKITKNLNIKYKFEFENISIRPPIMGTDGQYMFPMDARENNLTYASKIVAKVTQIQEISDIYTKKIISHRIIGNSEDNVPIATIPILVRSKYCSLNIKKDYDSNECEYDPGCYFIVNGAEKVVISQERMCENKPLVFIKKDSNSQIYVVQVNSRSPTINGLMQVMTINLKNNGILTLRVPILTEFPILLLFRALGIESDREIIDYIVHDKNDIDMLELVIKSIRLSTDDKGKSIKTQYDAINYLSNKIRILRKYSETDKDIRQKQKRLHLEYLLENNFLPHITGGKKAKAFYIGYMINKLLNCALGRTLPDDRDSYLNKRVDLVGNLMDELFRQFFRKMLNECNKYFKKRNTNDEEPINIINQIRPNTIEQGLKAALLTGAWGKKKGVAQVLQRLTYLQAIEFFRRIDSPSNDASSSKLTHPRHLHGTQNGNLCPVETPEHAKVGLVKHLTIIGSVTVPTISQIYVINEIISKKLIYLDDIHPSQLINYTKVFLNGNWIGVCEKAMSIYIELKNMKYNGTIEATTSIIYDDETNEIKIYCDGGRLYRPILRVKNNELLLTKNHINLISSNKTRSETMITSWEEFIQRNPGVIEYVDSEEQSYSMISPCIETLYNVKNKEIQTHEKAGKTKEIDKTNRYNDMSFVKYSHCEIHPSLLLGLIATNIPFLNHNQGPRNIFQYAQGRQAMCIYISNYRYRLDTSFILYHPQKPLVNTRTSKYMYNDILSPGENAIVAIGCYTGYNQEDSIVFNKSAIERGLFRSTSYNKYISIIQKNQSTSQDDIFMKPDTTKVAGMKHGSYDKLNEKGFVPEETTVVNGDFLIGKVSPIQPTANSNKVFKDNSESYKQHVPGVVDKVYSDIYNVEGYEMKKMRVRSERIPTIGDKYCLPIDLFEILTDQGWKYLNDITPNNKIATLSKDKELIYEYPIGIYKFHYSGNMYKVRSQYVDIDVTMDHQLYIKKQYRNKFELTQAKNIVGKQYSFRKNCKLFKNKNIQTITIDENVVNYDAYLKLLGMFISDGYIKNDNTIIIINKKKYNINNISNICKLLKIKIKFNNDSNIFEFGCIYEIESKTIAQMFKQININVTNKYLPDYVWSLNMKQSKILLESIISSNELYNNNDSANYYTSSKQMADDMMRLAIHAGWSGSIKLLKENNLCDSYSYDSNGINNTNLYCINIIKINNKPLINQSFSKKCETIYHFDGIVGCLEVSSHVFMIRQNNKNVWIGNCSRHGQKGTIGVILPQSDMPFTEKGITPDLIINPNAIPSRMTIGQLIECLLGKVGAIRGHECDGTAFTRIDIDDVKNELEKLGYERNGSEFMYNGMTGQKMQSMIFIGPTYYQRLKHLVRDKVHCLCSKTTDVLTYAGWKKSNEITMDDQIATLKNGELVYEKPINIYNYPDYEGEMYSIETQQIDFKVTSNHRMWISEQKYGLDNNETQYYNFAYAKDIVGKYCKYLKNAKWNAPDFQIYIPPIVDNDAIIAKKFVDMDSWIQLFGIFITNGYVKQKNDKQNNIILNLYYEYKRKILKNIIPKLGFDFVETKIKKSIHNKFKINNKQLYSYLKQFDVDETKKFLPNWVWNLSERQAKLLLNSMILDNKDYEHMNYTTSSKQLANDVMRLCLHCGWSGDISIVVHSKDKTVINGENIISEYNEFNIDINVKYNMPEVNDNNKNEILKIEKCPVFCLEVPSGVFYVRRNGKSAWTGNSRARGPKTLLLHQPSEGRSRGGGMRIGEMERDALIAHGVSKYIKEKLMDTSDVYTTYVCDECGLFAQRINKQGNKIYASNNDVYECPACKNKINISKIVIPYAFKLLVQELMSMCIAPRIRTINDKYTQ